ncbi:hypothetical protein EVAR_56034_1 [Eumeta japonica]|uniref:Uncharacterized protein n=1 Tax=Eumeta variegata TaxID=151549 RepID=A0A4C1YMN2_EUMVA|nr:hypothetical protein EVAR_56034_1 [Eumeta japonica]
MRLVTRGEAGLIDQAGLTRTAPAPIPLRSISFVSYRFYRRESRRVQNERVTALVKSRQRSFPVDLAGKKGFRSLHRRWYGGLLHKAALNLVRGRLRRQEERFKKESKLSNVHRNCELHNQTLHRTRHRFATAFYTRCSAFKRQLFAASFFGRVTKQHRGGDI